MLLFSLFSFFIKSLFLCVRGEAAGMRNECKGLVRIKKGYGWQLEEHPKIAGAVSLLGSRGWDQGGSGGLSSSSCCGEGGWGQPALQGDGAFLCRVLATCPAREARSSVGSCWRGGHVMRSSKNFPPPPPEVLKSCALLCSRSRPEAQGLGLCSEKASKCVGEQDLGFL